MRVTIMILLTAMLSLACVLAFFHQHTEQAMHDAAVYNAGVLHAVKAEATLHVIRRANHQEVTILLQGTGTVAPCMTGYVPPSWPKYGKTVSSIAPDKTCNWEKVGK